MKSSVGVFTAVLLTLVFLTSVSCVNPGASTIRFDTFSKVSRCRRQSISPHSHRNPIARLDVKRYWLYGIIGS
jgi:hypothetical protein